MPNTAQNYIIVAKQLELNSILLSILQTIATQLVNVRGIIPPLIQ